MNITGFDDNDVVTPIPDAVDYIEEVPERGNPVIAAEDQCVVCGTGLVYGGRGPHPKYCDDHKRNKSSNTKTASTRGIAAQVERAVSELESIYRMAGLGLRYMDNHAGTTVHDKASYLADSWRAVLDTNKAVRNAFISTEQKLAWLPLIVAHGDVAASIFFNRLAEQHNLFSQTPPTVPTESNGHDPDYIPAGFSGDDV